MKFSETPLAGAYTVDLEPHKDERGYFARTYCKREFRSIDFDKEFVQHNHSMSMQKGTLRGMHYQVPPSAEAKLIRCIRGEVFDVIIDLRMESPTFLQHFSVMLSEENMKMIFVPEGFAHGFQTTQEQTQLIYHHTAFYSPEDERGLNYADPAFGIRWPFKPANLSDRDQNHPYIDDNFTGVSL